MSQKHFMLTGVEPLTNHRLRLSYADEMTFEVNLDEWIKTSKALQAILDDSLFMQARIGFAARSVTWIEDELELGADNLRNLAVEQAGGIGHERIWNWLHDTGLTLDQAALALGISRRMIIYYRNGEKPIPRSIWLACLGWEVVRPTGGALPKQIPTSREYAAMHA